MIEELLKNKIELQDFIYLKNKDEVIKVSTQDLIDYITTSPMRQTYYTILKKLILFDQTTHIPLYLTKIAKDMYLKEVIKEKQYKL